MSRPSARVGVISNPSSGHNRDHFASVETALACCPGVVQHAVTDCPAAIYGALDRLATSHVDTLVINGGDGTVAAVLGAMLEGGAFLQQPAVIILPAGTANMTAGDVGVRGRLRSAVSRLCRWATAPVAEQISCERVQRNILRLDMDGAIHHGMFLGAGAIIGGTEFAHRAIHARGVRDDTSLALSTLRTVWGVMRQDPAFCTPTRVSIRSDDAEEQNHDALILALSTLQRLSFGMRPFWGEGEGPLRLTVVDRGCRSFLPNFVSIIRGRPGPGARPDRGYHSTNARALQIDMEGPINLDGELLTTTGSLVVTATAPVTFLRL